MRNLIAFSGGCFSGKTTTINAIHELSGKNTILLSELMREKKIESIDEIRKNPGQYLALQQSIIYGKMQQERDQLLYDDNKVVLIDRAITDSLFYLLTYVNKTELSNDELLVYNKLIHDCSMHCDWSRRNYAAVVEFYPIETKCEDTVFRPKNIDSMKYVEHTAISLFNSLYYSEHVGLAPVFLKVNLSGFNNPITIKNTLCHKLGLSF